MAQRAKTPSRRLAAPVSASFTRSYFYGSFAISEPIAVDYFPFADELIRFEEAAFLADVIPGSPCRGGVLPAPNPPTPPLR